MHSSNAVQCTFLMIMCNICIESVPILVSFVKTVLVRSNNLGADALSSFI